MVLPSRTVHIKKLYTSPTFQLPLQVVYRVLSSDMLPRNSPHYTPAATQGISSVRSICEICGQIRRLPPPVEELHARYPILTPIYVINRKWYFRCPYCDYHATKNKIKAANEKVEMVEERIKQAYAGGDIEMLYRNGILPRLLLEKEERARKRDFDIEMALEGFWGIWVMVGVETYMTGN
jgi:hypothetical protein